MSCDEVKPSKGQRHTRNKRANDIKLMEQVLLDSNTTQCKVTKYNEFFNSPLKIKPTNRNTIEIHSSKYKSITFSCFQPTFRKTQSKGVTKESLKKNTRANNKRQQRYSSLPKCNVHTKCLSNSEVNASVAKCTHTNNNNTTSNYTEHVASETNSNCDYYTFVNPWKYFKVNQNGDIDPWALT